MKIPAASIFIFLLVPVFVFAGNRNPRTNNPELDTKFIAHRGASYLAPENTIASITLAWAIEADAAECDIMLTKDKKVILFHDKTGKRLLGENLKISETNYEDLKSLPIKLKESNLDKYTNEKIPLLSDILPTIPEDRMLVIELKTGKEILEFLKPVVEESWKSGYISFIAFDYETIIAAKELFPDIPCYYLSAFKSDINRRFYDLSNSNLDGVNLRHKIIDEDLVHKFNVRDLDVWCWTVNDPGEALKMEKAGVTHITTDRPQWLKKQLTHPVD